MLVYGILLREGATRKQRSPTSGSACMARATVRLVRRASYRQMQIDGGTMRAYIPVHYGTHARV